MWSATIEIQQSRVMGLKETIERRRRIAIQQRKEKLVNSLKKIAESGLLERHRAKVVVFGSILTDSFGPWSDVDLAIMEAEDVYALVGRMLSYFESEDDVDICVFEMLSPKLQEVILREGVELREFIKGFAKTDS